MVLCLERIKTDVERCFPDDKRANDLVNDLLHHFCWKLLDEENKLIEIEAA